MQKDNPSIPSAQFAHCMSIPVGDDEKPISNFRRLIACTSPHIMTFPADHMVGGKQPWVFQETQQNEIIREWTRVLSLEEVKTLVRENEVEDRETNWGLKPRFFKSSLL